MKTFALDIKVYSFEELSKKIQAQVIEDILEDDEDNWVLAAAYNIETDQLLKDYKSHINSAVQTNGLIHYAYEGFFSQGAGGSFTIDNTFYIKFTYDEENQLFVFGNPQPLGECDELAIYGSVPCSFSGYLKKSLEEQNFSVDDILLFLNEASFDLCRMKSHHVHEKTIICVPYGNNASLVQYLETEIPEDQYQKITDYGDKLLEEIANRLEEVFQDLSRDLFSKLEKAYRSIYSTEFIGQLLSSEDTAWEFFCNDPEEFLGFTENGIEIKLTPGYTVTSMSVV